VDCAAIDLHKKESQMRIVTEGGGIVDRDDRLTGGVPGRDADADSGGVLSRRASAIGPRR